MESRVPSPALQKSRNRLRLGFNQSQPIERLLPFLLIYPPNWFAPEERVQRSAPEMGVKRRPTLYGESLKVPQPPPTLPTKLVGTAGTLSFSTAFHPSTLGDPRCRRRPHHYYLVVAADPIPPPCRHPPVPRIIPTSSPPRPGACRPSYRRRPFFGVECWRK